VVFVETLSWGRCYVIELNIPPIPPFDTISGQVAVPVFTELQDIILPTLFRPHIHTKTRNDHSAARKCPVHSRPGIHIRFAVDFGHRHVGP
jgi:hypothetical protein